MSRQSLLSTDCFAVVVCHFQCRLTFPIAVFRYQKFSIISSQHFHEQGCELAHQQVEEIDVDLCKDLVNDHYDAIVATIGYVADSADDATPEEYCTYAGVC